MPQLSEESRYRISNVIGSVLVCLDNGDIDVISAMEVIEAFQAGVFPEEHGVLDLRNCSPEPEQT